VDLFPGELVAVSGPSGVGKSVLGSLILRLRNLSEGSELFWGERDVSRLGAGALQPLRTDFQGLLQQTGAILPPFRTVRESLLETVQYVDTSAPGGEVAETKVVEVAERLGISRLLDRHPRFLSGGEGRKSGVARLLLARPRFAFVDEPDAGLDPVSQHEVLKLLREAVDETGVSMLLVTHSAVLAKVYADRRIVLRRGELHES
jgi:ABC-type glutathione transport system ATPase component